MAGTGEMTIVGNQTPGSFVTLPPAYHQKGIVRYIVESYHDGKRISTDQENHLSTLSLLKRLLPLAKRPFAPVMPLPLKRPAVCNRSLPLACI